MPTPAACVVSVKPQVLRLETTGSFTVQSAVDESGRCGLADSPRRLAFKVVIWSSPDALNEQGFIIDWQEIHAYFERTYRDVGVFPSCELIACQSCGDIVGLLDGRCLAMEITIGSGNRPAGMTARWACPDFMQINQGGE